MVEEVEPVSDLQTSSRNQIWRDADRYLVEEVERKL